MSQDSDRLLTNALELVSELLDATSGIDKTLLTGVGRMRVHRDFTKNHVMIFAINLLLTSRRQCGLGEELLTSSHILETDVVESRMNISFHGNSRFSALPLTRLEAGIGLVNHVDTTLTANNLTIRVTLLGRFNGGDDFHKEPENRDLASDCQPKFGRKSVQCRIIRLIGQQTPFHTLRTKDIAPQTLILLMRNEIVG